ncbi:hypothetical protein [Martelella alba]|uniref:Uncharacterized protein n=1 Tax=Martelella alba TaxID=2590451 RepID=A0ABY2SRG3_9HYPH|nr:hypothetical protein [Martelella alba]TKI08158.1 hypothetical protein FCN80_03115 [Martelella alba]
MSLKTDLPEILQIVFSEAGFVFVPDEFVLESPEWSGLNYRGYESLVHWAILLAILAPADA